MNGVTEPWESGPPAFKENVEPPIYEIQGHLELEDKTVTEEKNRADEFFLATQCLREAASTSSSSSSLDVRKIPDFLKNSYCSNIWKNRVK